MIKEFDFIKYHHDNNGNIEILFLNNQSNESLYFDRGNFIFINSNIVDNYPDWLKIDLKGEIANIRQTDDYDIILKLSSNVYIKIFYTPNDNFPNGVEQIFTIIDNKSQNYDSLLEDFNLRSSEIEI